MDGASEQGSMGMAGRTDFAHERKCERPREQEDLFGAGKSVVEYMVLGVAGELYLLCIWSGV